MGLRTPRAVLAAPALRAALGVWAATFCAFVAIGAALPVLPAYVRGPVGAGDVAVGIVVGCFALAAIVGRPVAGRLADARGRKPIVIAGMLAAAVGGALYFLPLGVPGLIAARMVLGVGDGWVFTGAATWIVDVAPEERRGQALGLFGLAIWSGLTVGPLVGEALLSVGSYEAVWALCAAAPLLGALVASRVTAPVRTPVPVVAARGWRGVVPAEVVRPGISLALANVGYGVLAAFVVLHLEDRGVGHGAAVFTTFAAAVVLVRLGLGALPDRLGAARVAALAAGAEAVGLALLAVAPGLPAAVGGALLMGAGFSLLFPALALLAVERVPPERRGAAIGAYTAFFDLGVGLGAPLGGALAVLGGYEAAFLGAAAAAAAGCVATTSSYRRRTAAVASSVPSAATALTRT